MPRRTPFDASMDNTQDPQRTDAFVDPTYQAANPDIIDDFESGNLNAYPKENKGFQVVTGSSTEAMNGSAYLYNDGVDQETSIIVSAPGDGLNRYFSKGDIARMGVYGGTGNEVKRMMLFGVGDPPDWDKCYAARLYDNGSSVEIQIRRHDGPSTRTTLATTSVNYPSGSTWHEIRVAWDDGNLGGSDNDINVSFISDALGSPSTEGQVTANDSTYADRSGVGVWSQNTVEAEMRFDWFRYDTSALPGKLVTIVDSFEDQDLTEYTGMEASDDGKSFVQSPVFDGTYALEITSFESLAYSTSGLNAYPSKGQKFNFYIRVDTSNGRPQQIFGLEDSSNYYLVDLDYPDGSFRLKKNDGGSLSTLTEDTNVSYTLGQWYKVHVEWDDGTLGGSDNDIRVDLVDTTGPSTDSSLSNNDSSHANSDGVGLIAKEHGTDCKQYFDYWHIE